MIKWLGWAALGALAFVSAGCGGSADPVEYASVRFVHASPAIGGPPNVDVLADDELAFANVPYGEARGYVRVASGLRDFRLRPTGTTTDATSLRAVLINGRAYTVLAINATEAVRLWLLEDNRQAPPAGSFRLRLVHAAPAAPAVDVYVTEQGIDDIGRLEPQVRALAYQSTTGYLTLTAGRYRVRLTVAGTKEVVFDSGEVPFRAGEVQTAVALEQEDRGLPLEVELFDDRG